MNGILSCLSSQDNIGVSSCKKLPQQIKGMITTPASFSLSYTDAATSTAWQTALLAAKGSRIYLWPAAVAMENLSEETVYEETNLGTTFVRDGRYKFKLTFRENLQMHKAMFSHKGFDGRVFFIDSDNKIIGTTLSDGTFAGFNLDLLNPEKLMFNTGDATSKTPVMVSLEDNLELDRSGAQIDGTFTKSLIALTSVTLEEVGTSTSSLIVVNVLSSLDNAPLLGLEVADFSFSGGTISGITDNGDGSYDLAGTGLTTGSLNLLAAASLSIVGFESAGAITITIA